MGGGFDAFEVLASGAFDHLNCQHTKSQMPRGLPEGGGGRAVLELTCTS